MNIKESTEKLFNASILSFSERVKICEMSFTTLATNIPSYNKILDYMNLFSERDVVQIDFVINEEVLRVHKDIPNEDYISFLSILEHNDEVSVYINIQKNVEKSTLTVYSYLDFVNDLIKNSSLGLLNIFNNLLQNEGKLIFEVYDRDIFWCTKTIAFISNSNICFESKMNRLDIIDKSKMVTYNYSNIVSLLPDDFYIETNYNDNKLTGIFGKLNTILSLMHLSSITTIQNDIITCQICGQRNLSYDYNLDEIKPNINLYNIYSWVYTDGNPTDKSVIAQNLLSLHCKYTRIIDTDAKTFHAITSSYQIYLKDNVNKYLEVKEKVAEFICNTVSSIDDIVSNLFSDFKKNIVAVLGFLISVVLVNIVSSQPIDNIFTKDITILLELALIFSIFFFIICLVETKNKSKRCFDIYTNLKKNYIDIFSEDELNEIFKNDSLFVETQKRTKRKIAFVSIIWVVCILLGLIVIECTSDHPCISKLFCAMIESIKQIVDSLIIMCSKN